MTDERMGGEKFTQVAKRFCMKIYWCLLAAVAAFYIAVGYFAYQNGKMAICVLICVVLVLAGIYSVRVIWRKGHLADIRLIMVSAYVVYNIYAPTVYCFFNSGNIKFLDGSNWVFEEGDIVAALVISALYLLGMTLSLFSEKDREDYEVQTEGDEPGEDFIFRMRSFYFWLAVFLVCCAWYIYPYFSMGFANALSIERWARYLEFGKIVSAAGTKGKLISIFFGSYLIILGLFIMYKKAFEDSRMRKEKFIWCVLFLAWSAFLLFMDGRRRELVLLAIMIFSLEMFKAVKKGDYGIFKKKVAIAIAVTVMFGGFAVQYQYLRDHLQIGYEKGIASMIESYRNRSEIGEQGYYNNEFGMVYVTNLASYANSPERLYGFSYVEALFHPVPIASKALEWMGDGGDDTSIESWLADIYPEWYDVGGGLGYSPASEAYVNMGYLGCVLIGFAMGSLFNILNRRLYSSKWLVFYCILAAQMYNFSRSAFSEITYEILWMAGYYVLYSTIARIISPRNPTKLTYSILVKNYSIVIIFIVIGSMVAMAEITEKISSIRRDEESIIFYEDFEDGDLKKWSAVERAPKNADAIEIVRDKMDENNKVAKFTNSDYDREGDGWSPRSELIYDRNEKGEDEEWYSWKFMVDSGHSNESEWEVVGQWHAVPDSQKGQTWENWEYGDVSPPVAVFLNGSDIHILVHDAKTGRALESRLYKIERDEWVNLEFHIKWSQEEDGFVEAWINDEPLMFDYFGTYHRMYLPNMLNDVPNILKIGTYRQKTEDGISRVYFDEIKISSN